MFDATSDITIDDGSPPVAIVALHDEALEPAASSPTYVGLGALLDDGMRHIILDCSRLETPNSTVLALAIWTHRRVLTHGRLALVASPDLERMCETAKLDRMLLVCPDLATALVEVRRDDSERPGSGGARVPRPTGGPSDEGRIALDPPDSEDDVER